MILDHSGFFFGPFFKNYLISLLFRDTNSQVLYRRKNGNNWRETMEFDLRSTADHHSRVFSPPLSSGHRRLCPRADVKTTTSTSETVGASTFKAWVHPPRDTHTHTHEPDSPSSILPQVFSPHIRTRNRDFWRAIVARSRSLFTCCPRTRPFTWARGGKGWRKGVKTDWRKTLFSIILSEKQTGWFV